MSLFPTISSQDWRDSIRTARQTPNSIALKIQSITQSEQERVVAKLRAMEKEKAPSMVLDRCDARLILARLEALEAILTKGTSEAAPLAQNPV